MKHVPFVISLLLGCGTRQDVIEEPNTVGLFVPCQQEVCSTGAPIASSADFVAAVDSSVPWTGFGEYTAGCLPASPDHVVTGPVTVRGADIPLPPNGANTFKPEPRFVLRDEPPGVICEEPEHLFDFTLCNRIVITNTTIRLRTLLVDIHPAPGNHVAVVEVLSGCEAPCADQRVCEQTHTCWNSERDLCAYCYGGTNEACACFVAGQLQVDGTECEMFVSGDVIVTGRCVAGECVE
jgi:hypothetical protein